MSLIKFINYVGNFSLSKAISKSFSFFIKTPRNGIFVRNSSIVIPLFNNTPIQSRSSEVDGNFLIFVIALNAQKWLRHCSNKFSFNFGQCKLHISLINSLEGNSIQWNTHLLKKASGSSFSLLEVMITIGLVLVLTNSFVSLI